MMEADVFELVGETLRKLDSQVHALQQEQQQYLQCRKGCSGCCMDGFKIRYVEAMNLLRGFIAAPPEIAQAVIENLQTPSEESRRQCPLLVNGACALYAHRPALCRAYGLMIQLKENYSTCPLNFKDLANGTPVKVFDLAPYYILLDDLSERLWQAAPNTRLSHDAEPPNWSIRQFFEAFLSIPSPMQAGCPVPAIVPTGPHS